LLDPIPFFIQVIEYHQYISTMNGIAIAHRTRSTRPSRKLRSIVTTLRVPHDGRPSLSRRKSVSTQQILRATSLGHRRQKCLVFSWDHWVQHLHCDNVHHDQWLGLKLNDLIVWRKYWDLGLLHFHVSYGLTISMYYLEFDLDGRAMQMASRAINV
jgi:hypothetical protein